MAQGPNVPQIRVGVYWLESNNHMNSELGYLQGVGDITDEDKGDIAAFGHKEAEERQALGIKDWHGEAGFSTLERR